MNIRKHNSIAWDKQVDLGNRWMVPVSRKDIKAAKQGRWNVLLTPPRLVPHDWFPELNGLETLCLASGGGQQGPILAAAGARVTVLDNSPKQLEQDRVVAEENLLAITTVEGDMADLSMFSNESIDLIFHPCSNNFVPDVIPVWTEAFRVLRKGGTLLSGFASPVRYIFDDELSDQGILKVRHKIPYTSLSSLNEDEK